ncbi:MAG: SIR2 family protein [Planctomycetota bacterium]
MTADKGLVVTNRVRALNVLRHADVTSRPVVFLLGAGISADAGIPLGGQLAQYLSEVEAHARRLKLPVRQYLDENRWPSRHDLRIETLFAIGSNNRQQWTAHAFRSAFQRALISNVRSSSPPLAEAFRRLLEESWKWVESTKQTTSSLDTFANRFAEANKSTVAYRTLLYYLCDSNQASIDACIDHFIRGRSPTTTHQFIAYIIQRLRSSIVLSTNFDPLLERALQMEGVTTSVYEMQSGRSLPSINLLLSQEMSIVKLHGGAHQMQMGFDLDEPLSQAALSSFYELFGRLYDETDQEPLIVAIGYGGGDRRVMDIVASRVRAWRNGAPPNVLWINRWSETPGYLEEAIAARNQVYRRSGVSPTGESIPTFVPNDVSALHLNYRDGRLFAAEVFQALNESLPIAQDFYQAINDSPHPSLDGIAWDFKRLESDTKLHEPEKQDETSQGSTQTADITIDNVTRRQSTTYGHVPREGLIDWTCCVIDGVRDSGTSSYLASLCEQHESEYQATVLWVDMEHHDTFAAFVDYLTSRLSKFDSRLPKLSRPLCLETVPSPYTGVENIPDDIDEHERTTAVRWLQHALRRSAYVLALDSLDEFGRLHPSDAGDLAKGTVNPDLQVPKIEHETKLLYDFLVELVRTSDNRVADLGFSRVAVAYTRSGTECAEWDRTLARLECVPAPNTFKDKTRETIRALFVANSTFEAGAQTMLNTPDPVRPQDALTAWRNLTDESNDLTPCLSDEEWNAIRKLGRVTSHNTPTDAPNRESAWIVAIIYAVAIACRRERSNVLVQRTTLDLLRLIGRPTATPFADCPEDLRERASDGNPRSLGDAFRRVINGDSESVDDVWKSINKLVSGGLSRSHHPTDRDDFLFVRVWHERVLSIFEGQSTSTKEHAAKNIRDTLPAMHHREGGYTWIPKDARNHLYAHIVEDHPDLMAWAHHLIAEYYLSGVYERSHDARAFVEYLAHQRAAVALAFRADRFKTAIGLLGRAAALIDRERSTLLVRAPIPKLLTEINRLIETIDAGLTRVLEAEGKLERSTVEYAGRSAVLVLDALGGFLTASGHPNHALDAQVRRLRLLHHPSVFFLATKDTQPSPDETLLTISNELKLAFNIRSFSEPINEPILQSDQLKTRSKAFLKHDHVSMLRAMMDFADTLTAPLLFDSKGRQWAERLRNQQNEHLSTLNDDALDRVVERREKEERIAGRIDTRETRCSNAHELLKVCLATVSKWADKLPPRLQPSKIHHSTDDGPYYFSDVKLGLLPMCQRRSLEYDLLGYSDLYLRGVELYCKAAEQVKPPAPSARHEAIANKYLPLFQYRSQRHRHECYRLCLTARIDQGECLAKEETASDRFDEFDALYPLLVQRLDAAEAGLERGQGPSNSQALAMTRLLAAELGVRHAELRAAIGKHASQGQVLAARAIRSVDAIQLRGREENRWRFLHSLIRARFELVRGYTLHKKDYRGRCDAIYSAARHLHNATLNCGLLTDRRIVLDLWFGATLQELVKLEADAPTPGKNTGPNRYSVQFLLSWLGYSWSLDEEPRELRDQLDVEEAETRLVNTTASKSRAP